MQTEAEDIFIQGYFAFYVLYFCLMALQTQFAQTAHGLGRRYRRLNLAIENAFPSTCGECSFDYNVTFSSQQLNVQRTLQSIRNGMQRPLRRI